jgi:hypothetical protein
VAEIIPFIACKTCGGNKTPLRYWNELNEWCVLAATYVLLGLGLVTQEMLNADIDAPNPKEHDREA